MNWQLNKIQFPVYNLGEGKRLGIWVQGCDLACPGCVSKTLWSHSGGKSVPVLELFNWLAPISENFDGLTISGGEPFQQYEALIAFLHLVKLKTKLKVHLFTGYSLGELNEFFPDKLFYRYIDTMVDGRYMREQHGNSPVRGSANQKYYQFIGQMPVEIPDFQNSGKWSVYIDEENRIFMAGIPKKNELNDICAQLQKLGIKKRFK